MFDIGWGELLVIGVVALIAIGPKELPGVLRTTGQWMGKVRRMASEFQDQFRDAMREAELDDAKKKFDEMTDTAKNFTDFDPIGTVRKEIENLTKDPLAETPSPPPAATQDMPISSSELSSSSAPTPQAEPAAPTADPSQGRKPGEGA